MVRGLFLVSRMENQEQRAAITQQNIHSHILISCTCIKCMEKITSLYGLTLALCACMFYQLRKEATAAGSKTNSAYGAEKKTWSARKKLWVFYAVTLRLLCCAFDGKCEHLTENIADSLPLPSKAAKAVQNQQSGSKQTHFPPRSKSLTS